MIRRLLIALLAVALLNVGGPARGAQGGALVFAVSEGTSGAQDQSDIFLKYEPFAEFIGRALGRKVKFYLARDFLKLEEGMKRGSYDLVMARPSDYPARGVRDYGYRLVVTTKPEGHAVFIVRGDSPLKTIGEIKGRRIALPEDVAYMSRMASAALRDQGIDVKRESVSRHRDQAVIGYSVDIGVADVGAVASYSSVARDWEKKGGRVLYRGPARPYMPLIVSKSLAEDDVVRLRRALVDIERTEGGAAILRRLGVAGFEERDPGDLIQLLQWLGF